jgi:hypothetical protein
MYYQPQPTKEMVLIVLYLYLIVSAQPKQVVLVFYVLGF